MGFTSFTKFFLVILFPLALFLSVAYFVGFDYSFYEGKFNDYDIYSRVENADLINTKTLEFLNGRSEKIPDDYNEREKHHLWDVRELVAYLKYFLYFVIALFIVFLIYTGIRLKIKGFILGFFGKIFFYGGILTLAISLFALLLISLNFDLSFEIFHRIFFDKGSYMFDPSNEMIVNLYPEDLFRDIGLNISLWVVIFSVISAFAGFLLIRFFGGKNIKSPGKY